MATEGSSNLLLFNTSLVHMITLHKLSYMAWSDSPPLIENQDLIGHIDGSIVLPSKFNPATFQTPNDKYLAWRAADQRLLRLLPFSH